jgi:hypothetical protein
VVRQGKVKRGAGIDLAFGPSATVVTQNDAVDIGESDACAFKVLVVVQALKHAEQFADVAHVKARAIIAHGEYMAVGGIVAVENLNDGGIAMAGVFERVADQIASHLSQHGRVSIHGGQVADAPLDVASLDVGLKFLDAFVDDGAHIHILAVHLRPTHAAEHEQFINQ